MAANAKRRSRRRNSEESEELSLDGAKKPAKTAPPAPEGEGSEEEEEGDKSGDARPVRHARATAAPKPKEKPAKTAPPAPEGEDSEDEEESESLYARFVRQARATSAPKPKEAPERAKKPSPVSPDDAGARGSGESSPARDAPGDDLDSAAPPPRKKSKTDETAAASPRRQIAVPPAKKGAVPVRKRAKRSATPPQEEGGPSLVSKAPADEGRGLVASPGRKRGATPARKRGKRGATATPPQEEEEQAEEQQGNTSPPQMDEGAEEEEQQVEEVADHADNTSLPQEASPERNVSSPKMYASEGEKKPAVERSWSQDDELKILTALVKHAQSHGGALPDSSDLMANLTFDKIDANAFKLNDKIRKLRKRYHKLSSQGRPSDDLGRQMFDLSDALWGQGRQADDDVQVDTTFVDRDREFAQLSILYPYLAEEVKGYSEKHSSGNLIVEAFTTIGDDKARQLDAMCKKQRVDAFNLELSQAYLTKAVLSELSIQIN